MQSEIMNILPNQDDYVIGFADMADQIGRASCRERV